MIKSSTKLCYNKLQNWNHHETYFNLSSVNQVLSKKKKG